MKFTERRREHHGVSWARVKEAEDGTGREDPNTNAAAAAAPAVIKESPAADPLSLGHIGSFGVLAPTVNDSGERPIPVRPVRHQLRAPQQLRGAQGVLLRGESDRRRQGIRSRDGN